MTPEDRISNSEIFLWALYQLGGANAFVDVEDVFLKCFTVAPQRFAWRTKPDLPDYKKCSKALRDAEERRPKLLVKTGDSFGRQLTVEGQRWIRSHRDRLVEVLEGDKVVQEPKARPRARLLTEAERSAIFNEWRSSQRIPTEKWKVAELLKCSPDSDRTIWRDRLEVIRGAAYRAGKTELLKFFERLASEHPDWFNGGTK